MRIIVGVYLLVLLTVAHANQEECKAQIKKCLNIYTDNLTSHPKDLHLICRDANRAMACMEESDCNFSNYQKQALENKLQEQFSMYGFHCEIDLSKPENRVRETTMSPGNTPDPSTCMGGLRVCMRKYSDALSRVHSMQDICPMMSELLNCMFDSACHLEEIKTEFTRITENAIRSYGVHCDLNVDHAYANYRAENKHDEHVRQHHVDVSALDNRGGYGSANNMRPRYFYDANHGDAENSKPHNAAMKTGFPQSIIISTVLTIFFLAGFELLL